MVYKIKCACWLALLACLFVPSSVFGKGGYAFILISGAHLKNPVRVSDPALTESFFAFANFYKARTGTPKEAGVGYEITRYYVDQNREVAFDRLHYYPDTGFVYYDGIVGGSSEYDRKWYLANAETKTVFENSLATSVVTPLGVPIDPFIAVIVVVVTLLGYAVWRSKFSTP